MGAARINSDGINHRLNYSGGLAKIYYNQDYLSGLAGTRYIGYHNDDPSWFSTAIQHCDDTNILNSIANFSSSPDFAQEDFYSWQWVGYFKPNTTEEYTFYTLSDDGSYLWIGESANSPTLINALINNGGQHPTQEISSSINLTANTYYPLRIQFGEFGGGDIITVSFSSNSISKTTNGDGYYFHLAEQIPQTTSNDNAGVVMYGWVGGDRCLDSAGGGCGSSPVGVIGPFGSYIYGDETVVYEDGVWKYKNMGNTIAFSIDGPNYPWLATWIEPFSASKWCEPQI